MATSTITQLIAPQQLGTGATTYYTSPASTVTLLKKLVFTNTSASPVTVTTYIIPSAGTASATNTIMSAIAIPAGKNYECYEAEGLVLPTGTFIQALASAATSVNIMAAGIQIV